MDIMFHMFDLIPVFGVVVTITVAVAGISLKAGRTLQKLDYVTERVTVLETKLADIEKNLHNRRLERLRAKLQLKSEGKD
jgi:hypothetical protein